MDVREICSKLEVQLLEPRVGRFAERLDEVVQIAEIVAGRFEQHVKMSAILLPASFDLIETLVDLLKAFVDFLKAFVDLLKARFHLRIEAAQSIVDRLQVIAGSHSWRHSAVRAMHDGCLSQSPDFPVTFGELLQLRL